MTATSGPGFSLMQEALGYAVMAEIPCVIVDVQRGGPSTGIPTHVSQGDVNQARWGTHGDHAIIALTASNHQDVFAITVEAFNLSETYRTPVILLFDEVVAHMRRAGHAGKSLVERLRTSVKRAWIIILSAAGGRAAAHVGFRRCAPVQRDRPVTTCGALDRTAHGSPCCGIWWISSRTVPMNWRATGILPRMLRSS
jgi:hypothetical protein